MTPNGRPNGGAGREAIRLGIVTPWFGPDLRGGAEQQSFQLATKLASRGYIVDVLTTCSASFSDDWSRNTLRPGVEKHGNLSIYRFKTRKRDRRAFERVNAILTELARERLPRSVSPIGDDDATIFYEENINAPALLSHLSERGKSYHSIIFIPYLYGTTLNGLPLVADRAYLQPCFHDEPYAYLQRVRENVHSARGLLLNSEGELELAVSLFGPGIIKKSAIVGEGVLTDITSEKHAQHIGTFAPREHAYVLYLGRQDETKNVGTLVQAWIGFKRRRPTSRLQLILAGQHGGSNSDKLRAIGDLGSVSMAERNALLANCAALVQPSLNESFSRVLYEAWLHGRPVIVHGDCLATATAVRRCGGGLVASTVPEWEAALQSIDEATPAQLAQFGKLGRSFARDYASWDAVIGRYEHVLGLESKRLLHQPGAQVTVRQIVPDDETVRRYAVALAGAIERQAASNDAGAQNGSIPQASADTAVVMHYVCNGQVAANDTSPSAIQSLVFHATDQSSTPSEACTDDLRRYSHDSKAVFASTPRAIAQLRAAGVADVRFAPISVDPREWDIVPDHALAAALHDGKQNLLYVGALANQAHLDDLLIAFLHYLTLEREARLTIVGTGDVDDALYKRLLEEVHRLDLSDHVLVARNLSPEQFVAVFRAADLFVSLDDAEHLGEAFLQAMWFDVPILAYRTEIAQALVGQAGVLITDKSDLLAVAALAQLLVVDPTLRKCVLAAQRRMRAEFDTQTLVQRIAPCHDVPV